MVISKELNDSIEITVEKLRNKEVVIIPTDTVYGFSGIVPWTEDYIRQIKGREENKPFIQLIAHPKDICKIGDTMRVIVTEIKQGKVGVSRKELLPKPQREEKK